VSLPQAGAVPQELIMQLAGILPEGEDFGRRTLFDELLTTIPKEPSVQTLVYQSELSAGIAVPWHIHNGPIIALIVQGEIVLQFPHGGEAYSYKAGEVFVEPIGVVHRAYNPNPDVTMLSIAFQLTPPDRDHIVLVDTVPDDVRPEHVPPGSPQPQATLVGGLAGSIDTST
jgi:quercetin dioxygenase-like cupin family protein